MSFVNVLSLILVACFAFVLRFINLFTSDSTFPFRKWLFSLNWSCSRVRGGFKVLIRRRESWISKHNVGVSSHIQFQIIAGITGVNAFHWYLIKISQWRSSLQLCFVQLSGWINNFQHSLHIAQYILGLAHGVSN